jgi:methionyl-tRNA formyltransferase
MVCRVDRAEGRRNDVAVSEVCRLALGEAAWAEELEVLQEVLVENILRHLLNHACILLHEFFLVLNFQLLKLVLLGIRNRFYGKC